MFKNTLIGAASLLGLTFAGALAVNAQDTVTEVPILDCDISAPAPENSCLLRLPASYKSRSVSASKANGENYGASWEFVDRDFFSGSKAFSGTMILVDITLGAGNGRNATFERREKNYIRDIINQLPDGEAVAVYTFDTKIKKVSDFSTNHARALSAVDDITLTGLQTWIGENILDAVSIMKNNDNFVMKSVVVVSDGLDESKVSAGEVIKAAVDQRVSISALGAFWRGQGHADNGTGGAYLSNFAKRTNGEYTGIVMARADAQGEVDDFAETLNSSRTESRLVRLKAGEVAEAGQITVTVDRPVLGAENELEQVQFTANFTPVIDPSVEIDEPVEAAPQTLVQQATAWLTLNWYYVLAGLLVLFLLLFFLLRRRDGDTEDLEDADLEDFDENTEGFDSGDDATEIASGVSGAGSETDQVQAPKRVVGHLYEKSSGQRLPLFAGATTLGRGSQNDIVIEDDSASRMHASVTFNGRGMFTVTDMSSLNGTYVNGKKIERDHIARNGDTIKFGEYELILQAT